MTRIASGGGGSSLRVGASGCAGAAFRRRGRVPPLDGVLGSTGACGIARIAIPARGPRGAPAHLALVRRGWKPAFSRGGGDLSPLQMEGWECSICGATRGAAACSASARHLWHVGRGSSPGTLPGDPWARPAGRHRTPAREVPIADRRLESVSDGSGPYIGAAFSVDSRRPGEGRR